MSNYLSVTGILQELRVKALEDWNYKIGLQGLPKEKIMIEAKTIGTALHSLVERGDFPSIPITEEQKKIVGNLYMQHIKWELENKPTYIYKEYSLTAPSEIFGTPGFTIKGKLDAIVQFEDKRILLLDWKTSSSIYESEWLQLAAYYQMLPENLDKYPVTEVGIVRLDKNGNNYEYKTMKVDSEEFQKYILLFNSLVAVAINRKLLPKLFNNWE